MIEYLQKVLTNENRKNINRHEFRKISNNLTALLIQEFFQKWNGLPLENRVPRKQALLRGKAFLCIRTCSAGNERAEDGSWRKKASGGNAENTRKDA